MFMEILRSPRILCTLFLILLEFSFTSQEEFYINCGSSSSINLGRRHFVGDVNSGSFTLTASRSTIVDNPSSGTNTSTALYRAARVFKRESWYEFGINQIGAYILRLHFFPFTSQDYNLFDAKFDVTASGVSLLSNFSVTSTINLPLVEEFLLTIHPGKFRINFAPSGSSLAFINAIELNVTISDPGLFIQKSAPHVTPLGLGNNSVSAFNGLLNNALHVIHRINVGGDEVNPDDDTLPRHWVRDDEYLISALNETEKNSSSSQPNYRDGYATKYDAPARVYLTARVMSRSSAIRLPPNVSWRFNVSKNDKFLVRAHFCDFLSPTIATMLRFNLYIYSSYSKEIDPVDVLGITSVAVPFYHDFIVDSDDSGFLNISIGKPLNDSKPLLNGLEIMKLMPVGDYSIPKQSSNNKIVIIIVSILGGTVFVVILSLAVFLFAFGKRKTKSVENFEGGGLPFLGGSSHSRKTSKQRNNDGSSLHVPYLGLKLALADILAATNNFDDKLIIGSGGFGKVYKGTLKKDGTKVAVKRCEAGGRQGLPEFQTEIMVLSKIRHRHLVSLIGFCDERSEMVLVYEFMEKGTLREHLYNCEKGRGRLSWEKRLQLCTDAAQGLHYLHSGLSGSIIHRDIKSTNILLDEHYVAKVADFGISRTGALEDQTHVTTEVKGTIGYLDPEYYKIIQLTQKSDIYSFGVVLLEVLCARAAIDNSLPGEQANLADWGTSCIVKGELEKLLDPFLVGKINQNSLRKFTETVEKCLRENGVDRPNMVDVLWDLEYALQLQKNCTNAALPPRQQTVNYSTTDVSCDSMMILPVINCSVPTHHESISTISKEQEEDSIPMRPLSSMCSSDTNRINASEIFSQLGIEEGR